MSTEWTEVLVPSSPAQGVSHPEGSGSCEPRGCPLGLVPLHVNGVECQVPAGGTLLGCFQYLRPYPISMGGFCGNADCHTCEVTLRTAAGLEEKVLSCQTTVLPGMTIVGMTGTLKFCLRGLDVSGKA